MNSVDIKKKKKKESQSQVSGIKLLPRYDLQLERSFNDINQ